MKRVFVFLLICIPFMSEAQTADPDSSACSASLSGKILDEHDSTFLSFATVYISELKIAVTADSNGNYTIPNICEGVYRVKISHIGCESITKKVTVKGNTVVNFNPEHHTEYLKNLDIVADKLPSQSTQTQSTLSQEKLNQSKGLSLADALKNITGVNTINTGSSISKPVIHGLHSNRILILNNGIRQEGQQWGVEHAPEIDPFVAGELSVVKGANSVRYGSDAMAGVILVNPKPLRDSAGINGEINLVGMSNGRAGTVSAYADGKFRKLPAFSWRAQGTLKQNGSVNAPDYVLVNTGLKEYNFSYTLQFLKPGYGGEIYYSQFNTTLGIFGASHIGNLTDLQKAFESSVPLETGDFSYKINRPYQHIEHELFKAKVFTRTGDAGKLSVVYARQYNLRYEYDKHRPLSDSLAGLNHPELQFEITTHTADLIWEHKTVKHLSGSIGLNGITQGNTYEGRALIPNFRNYNGGIFWIERWKKKRVELEAGARYDYKWLKVYRYQYMPQAGYELVTPVHQFKNLSGNLGGIFKKDSTLNFSFNLGTAWRAPSVSELYSDGLHHGAAAIEYGNSELKSEQAYNANLSLRFMKGKKFFMEASPYFNFFHNFIYRQPTAAPILTIRGAFPGFNYKQTEALLSGCDFYAEYSFSKQFQTVAKASVLRAWNKNENDWLIMMPADRAELELKYRFKEKKNTRDAYCSVSSQYVNKQWRVPHGVDFALPPSAYLLFNAHAACTFKIKKQTIELGLSVFNLLNTSYRDYLDRFRYFTDAMGRNVSLRLKVPFNLNQKPKNYENN